MASSTRGSPPSGKLDGQTTWRFKLRQGVKFHNVTRSRPPTPSSASERTYDPAAKTMVATVFSTIDKIEAPDPFTLVVTTKKPDPLLPARLAFYGGQIVPKKYVESVGNDTFNSKPVGTGPVRFGSWVKDDKAVLEANPDYWGGKIEVDRWTMRPIPETAPRIAALLKARSTSSPSFRPTRASGWPATPPRGWRARSTRASTCSGEQQAAAARQSAREAGPVAGH